MIRHKRVFALSALLLLSSISKAEYIAKVSLDFLPAGSIVFEGGNDGGNNGGNGNTDTEEACTEIGSRAAPVIASIPQIRFIGTEFKNKSCKGIIEITDCGIDPALANQLPDALIGLGFNESQIISDCGIDGGEEPDKVLNYNSKVMYRVLAESTPFDDKFESADKRDMLVIRKNGSAVQHIALLTMDFPYSSQYPHSYIDVGGSDCKFREVGFDGGDGYSAYGEAIGCANNLYNGLTPPNQITVSITSHSKAL